MEMTKKEFLVQDDSPVLKEFIKTNSEHLESLIKDSKTAQVGILSLSTHKAACIMFIIFTNIFAYPSRRLMPLSWSILERTPKPRSLPCFSRCLGAS